MTTRTAALIGALSGVALVFVIELVINILTRLAALEAGFRQIIAFLSQAGNV